MPWPSSLRSTVSKYVATSSARGSSSSVTPSTTPVRSGSAYCRLTSSLTSRSSVPVAIKKFTEFGGWEAGPSGDGMPEPASADRPGGAEHLVNRDRLQVALGDQLLELIEQAGHRRMIGVAEHDRSRLYPLLGQPEQIVRLLEGCITEGAVPHQD